MIDHDSRNFRMAWQLMILAVALWLLTGLYSRANAHDPDRPEYWPRNIDWAAINAGVDENFNTITGDEAFTFIGLTLMTCLIVALPQIFDGEYTNVAFVQKVTLVNNIEHLQILNGDPCIRLCFYSFSF